MKKISKIDKITYLVNIRHAKKTWFSRQYEISGIIYNITDRKYTLNILGTF